MSGDEVTAMDCSDSSQPTPGQFPLSSAAISAGNDIQMDDCSEQDSTRDKTGQHQNTTRQSSDASHDISSGIHTPGGLSTQGPQTASESPGGGISFPSTNLFAERGQFHNTPGDFSTYPGKAPEQCVQMTQPKPLKTGVQSEWSEWSSTPYKTRQQQDSMGNADVRPKTRNNSHTSAGEKAGIDQPTSNKDAASEPPTSHDNCAENKDEDEVEVTLLVKWLEDSKPQREKNALQKILQTWASKSSFNGSFTVVKVSEDGRAVTKIKPAAAMSKLTELIGKTLTGRDEKTVTITSVPEIEIKIPGNASVNSPSSSVPEPQHAEERFRKESKTTTSNVAMNTDGASVNPPSSDVEGQRREHSHMTTSTSDVTKHTDNASVDRPSSTVAEKEHEQVPQDGQSDSSNLAGEETSSCIVPLVHFCYLNQVFKEEIKRIERENGVTLTSEVRVTCESDQKKPKDAKKALSDFSDLVRKCLDNLDGSVIPFKSPDPEDLKIALKMVQKKENNILVSLSAEEICVFGPRQIHNVVSASLRAAQKYATSDYPSAGESTQASEDTSINIGMSINDHLADNGLTMEESCWKRMNTDKIREKFSVDLKVVDIGQGKVQVKARYKKSGRSPLMESHATRALLHQYQKIATSPIKNFTHLGAAGFSSSGKSMNSSYQSEAASSRPEMNGKPRHNALDTKASREEGATAADNEDENCPICRDKFTKKKQLKCKHEFCEECLEQSIKHLGSTCPVCKDVFGMVEGNQPEGTMSWTSSPLSLPGFPGCGTIVIDYYFPSGKQTEKHPNPGRHYDGTSRTAYLPGNKEGKEVLQLLERAFNQKLTFTVGRSTTTGMENQVTWNDIHHKTKIHGGPQSFGYPDPDYLTRVREELKAKGIK